VTAYPGTLEKSNDYVPEYYWMSGRPEKQAPEKQTGESLAVEYT